MELPVVRPMEPVPREKPFDDPAWVYQVKWDGIRLVSYIENGRTLLRTRGGRDCTGTYPELALAGRVRGDSAILDGEAVALDERGRPSFPRILRRHLGGPAGRKKAGGFLYVVFDLIYLNGEWLSDRPLTERQGLLETAVPETDLVRLCDNHSSGRELFAATARLGLEGIVAKEKQGAYHRGLKHRTWRKIRHFKELDVIAAGVVIKQGAANALLAAAYVGDELTYLGRVATGLKTADLRLFTELTEHARTPAPELANRAQIPRNIRIRWLSVRPVVRVRFMEWTAQGLMREPVIIGPGTCDESECRID